MPSEQALVDTNVLVDGLYKDSEHYSAARALLDQAQQLDAGFCITPQVLTEFYAVVTHPKRTTQPKSPHDALSVMGDFLAMPGMLLLLPPPDITARLMDLVRRYPQHLIGRKIFDGQLVATMLANGVKRIYTFNSKDFIPFSEIEVLEPKVS